MAAPRITRPDVRYDDSSTYPGLHARTTVGARSFSLAAIPKTISAPTTSTEVRSVKTSTNRRGVDQGRAWGIQLRKGKARLEVPPFGPRVPSDAWTDPRVRHRVSTCFKLLSMTTTATTTVVIDTMSIVIPTSTSGRNHSFVRPIRWIRQQTQWCPANCGSKGFKLLQPTKWDRIASWDAIRGIFSGSKTPSETVVRLLRLCTHGEGLLRFGIAFYQSFAFWIWGFGSIRWRMRG